MRPNAMASRRVHNQVIDRIEPTRRPNLRPRGYQQWRSLLFMHWSIPVEILRPLVPEPLELDLYQGSAYVGIVPFVMLRVRPWCLPARMGFDFLETNVRTYVHLNGRPGVFFSRSTRHRQSPCGPHANFGDSLIITLRCSMISMRTSAVISRCGVGPPSDLKHNTASAHESPTQSPVR